MRKSQPRSFFLGSALLLGVLLTACGTTGHAPACPPCGPAATPAGTQPAAKALQPVRWSELPGWNEDALHEAWSAWIRSCERPGAVFAALCPEIRLLSLASADEQRRWMLRRLQPYRVEPVGTPTEGLLTGYFEPSLVASRTRRAEFQVPLYRVPPGLAGRKPWYTRQEMDTLPEARARCV